MAVKAFSPRNSTLQQPYASLRPELAATSAWDDEFHVRPGRIRHGTRVGSLDHVPICIERANNSSFIAPHVWLNSLQSIGINEKRNFHCTVVSPESNAASSRIK